MRVHCGHARTASQYASLGVVKESHVAVSRTIPRALVVAAGDAVAVADPDAPSAPRTTVAGSTIKTNFTIIIIIIIIL